MIYPSPVSLQVSPTAPPSQRAGTATAAAAYHEPPLIFPLSSSITVTLQKPLHSDHLPKVSSSSSLLEEEEGDEEGYLLISESEVSSWIVGMRVPYPFTHPRYDPNKISTISHHPPLFPRHTLLPSSPLSSSSSRSKHPHPPSRHDTIAYQLFEEMLRTDFDYRHSAAFSEYEKCLFSPSSSSTADGGGSRGESGHCNLTEFIEIEKMKLANKYHFYHELNHGADPHGLFTSSSSSSSSHSDTLLTSSQTMEVNTVGLLVLAGIFGGIFVSLFIIIFLIVYFNYLNHLKTTTGSSTNSITLSGLVTHCHELSYKLLMMDPTTLGSHSLLPPSPSLPLNPSHGSGHHNLQIFHDQELGHGSYGTVVLRGLFEGRRHVAVKKMVSRFHNFERYFISLRVSLSHLCLSLC
jgi:hypothetical protein